MNSIPYTPPHTLWKQSPDEFNEWRRSNDLPLLFQYFLRKLPHFQVWLDSYGLDIPLLCRLVPTGEIFKGSGKKTIIEMESDNKKNKVVNCSSLNIDETMEYWKLRNKEVTVLGSFQPYFEWAKNKLGRERYFYSDRANNQRTDKFSYNLTEGYGDPEASRTYLFSDFKVLKLGGIELPQSIKIGARNLDFSDLDHLIISGNWHGNHETNISFSSCNYWKLNNAELCFFKFSQCNLERFDCSNSRLQDFYFEECSIGVIKFADTYVYRLTFDKSNFRPDFRSCDLNGLKFLPIKSFNFTATAEIYRCFRSAFQHYGKQIEASEMYYFEQVYKRKALFSPYIENRDQFPPMRYAGRINNIWHQYESGIFSSKDSLKHLWYISTFHLNKWINPKYFLITLKFKFKWFISVIEWVVWGYGERSSNIIYTAMSIIFGYSFAYYLRAGEIRFSDNAVKHAANYYECLYLSMTSFSTLGFGDISPASDLMKMLCVSEAILGGLMMGLVVAGFSNRHRY